jgi:Zn-dependent M28 family amino/carboxypeptidase
MFPKAFRILIVLAILAANFAFAPAVQAGPEACDVRVNNTHAKLLECVTLEGVRAHQAAFQAIADANGGHRFSGSPGYDASVDYAVSVFESSGYSVTVQPFEYQAFILLSPTILEQVSPPPAGPVPNNIMSYSGSGDVTAAVTTLAAPPADATPGCEAADFAGFPAGNIALVSRGACAFAIKATNAYNAGASGVIIYNNIPGALSGTLGNTFTLDIPVTSVTQAVGEQLAATPGLVMRLVTETFRGLATTYNVLAESGYGNPDNVVMVGAHLDSVNAGPGINDNGSGSAAILEVAKQMAKVRPFNKVRFALWGAEESGLVGSLYYVANLSQDELDKIALYLNFDMIGSPNFVRYVYDGDSSDTSGANPPGSGTIEQLFLDYFASLGLPTEPTEIGNRSDHAGFRNAGIPIGGLFTGAEGIKTPDQAALYGGTAGIAYDPCYHQACDTYDNVSLEALDQNSDAVAYATLNYAMNTQSINGLRGKGNFKPSDDDHVGSQLVR